jgi:hypothetical protein
MRVNLLSHNRFEKMADQGMKRGIKAIYFCNV